MLNKDLECGWLQPFSSGDMAISHLFYTDDLLIFCNGNKKSVGSLLELIKKYERIFGQLVSPLKSSIFCSKHITLARRRKLMALSRFKEGDSPCLYLGVPFF